MRLRTKPQVMKAASDTSAENLHERLGAQHDEEFDLAELHGRLEAVDFTSDQEYIAYGMSPDRITELRAWVRAWQDSLGLRLAEPYVEEDAEDDG
ncbi:hypothetical protein OG407_09750 [Streptomyces sp. NBC_01515]|uniref:hypothetical protein n=1 Tax=Streptomyces sp. NBC_01515 TaxID=2903890 RepID=UPI0038677477